jgi:hypothetical protein
MTGTKPRHWNWAHAAQVNVPLPDARITLRSGYNPEYDFKAHILYLPQPGRDGWTYRAEHGLFLHELGHVYDYADMTPVRRDAFKATAQTSCSWWAKHCYSLNRRSRQTIDLPPGEMFAEMYEACAMGMNARAGR